MLPLTPQSKVYVAGHTGLVGSAIVRHLLARGFSNLLLRTREQLDLLDGGAVDRFFRDESPEFVVLCAARVGGIKANMEHPAEFLYENLAIQNNVIWSAYRHGAEKLLFLGSSCIYPRMAPQPMAETSFLQGPPEPTNEGYAIAKIAGMKLCEKVHEQFGRRFVSCMPTNIYGPGDNFSPDSGHVIPALIRRMHEAKESGVPSVTVWGTGNARREFLYVDDLADACAYLLENFEERQFVNVGTGEDVSIRELADAVRSVVGYPGELVFDASKPDGMPRKLLDVTRLSAAGWRAKTGLRQGLESAYRSYLSSRG